MVNLLSLIKEKNIITQLDGNYMISKETLETVKFDKSKKPSYICNMLNKIIEYFYPHTNNPKSFVLKNKATWYSQKYRYVLYSGNNGKTFKKIHKAIQPLFSHRDNILEYNWTFEPMTFNAEEIAFIEFKNKFKSIKDIQDFENKEYQKYLNGREEVKQARIQYIENLNKNIQ